MSEIPLLLIANNCLGSVLLIEPQIIFKQFLKSVTKKKPWPTDSFSRYKTRVIPNNVCIVVSTQFNLNCIFRIDLIHLQQKMNQMKKNEDESNRFEIYSLN